MKDHFTQQPEKPYDWDTYFHSDVKDALYAVFGPKCAYCEGKYAAFHAMIVEHFRPKGEVLEEDGMRLRPGYFWLAVDWDNLLASCIDCNSWRYHELDTGERIRRGKANRFPLSDPTKRARAPGDDDEAYRLLIDPTRDDPAQFLCFTDRGIVRPRQTHDSERQRRAEVSIDVFGLDRPELVDRRRDLAILVLDRIEEVRFYARLCEDYPNDIRFAAKKEQALAKLAELTHESAEFSALARDLVRERGFLPPP
ncbi:MAG TPA: retron system putative HNH endonuclease [Candidatus Elarobacter sp.]|nr:retron system putative HNH endonuclease [Candidatus Elarobacter sp.]HEV2738065.1 retron system putative HNH endonuclease [Candidatus Elarobacter sp.]